MENEMILILVWAIIMTITLGILVVILLNLKKKHDQDIRDKENEIQDMNNKLEKKQTLSFQAGVNTTIGDYSQILGDFALLSKYDSIITLSTTSRQPSLDLIGINEESLDFLELKKEGSGSTTNEKHVKRLVEEKKVSYKIFDVDLPTNFSIKERMPKENTQKNETQKKYPNAYEPWTESDDEFLKKFWKDESNKQSRNEKIQELMQKFGRNRGAIVSRLNKIGFDLDEKY